MPAVACENDQDEEVGGEDGGFKRRHNEASSAGQSDDYTVE
jgi:hypothetical protein